MASVRQRLERQQREQEPPEKIITSDHRVALGASGPTMSTRMAQQLNEDATEVLTPSPHTRTGGTDFMSGVMVRVRDRQVATEAMKPLPPRPKTPEQLAGEAGLAMHERWEREKRESEQARIATRQKREADEKAAAELKQRRATIAFQEAAVLREASDLTADEAQIFRTRLASMDKMLDPIAASIIAEEIRSSRV